MNYCLTLEYRMNLKDAKYDEVCVPDKFLSCDQQKPTLANWSQIGFLKRYQVTHKSTDMLATKAKRTAGNNGRLGREEHKHSLMLCSAIASAPLSPSLVSSNKNNQLPRENSPTKIMSLLVTGFGFSLAIILILLSCCWI